ncbi:hypothetical protein T484DRAFT_1770183, partial [Baffinella frigidus]
MTGSDDADGVVAGSEREADEQAGARNPSAENENKTADNKTSRAAVVSPGPKSKTSQAASPDPTKSKAPQRHGAVSSPYPATEAVPAAWATLGTAGQMSDLSNETGRAAVPTRETNGDGRVG